MDKRTLLLAFKEGKYTAEEVLHLLHGDRMTAGEDRRLDLTESQKEMWMLQQLYPELTGFNLPIGIRINSGYQRAQFQETVRYIAQQYPILKCVYKEEDGQPYGLITDDAVPSVEILQTGYGLSHENLVRQMKKDFKQPFNLEDGSLTKVIVYERVSGEAYVLFNIHHLIFDGSSAIIFLEAFFNAYRDILQGQQPAGSSHTTDFGDYVQWEEAFLQSEDAAESLEYWKENLSGELPVTAFPADNPTQGTKEFHGDTKEFLIDGALYQSLMDYSKASGINLSVISLAAFNAFIHLYTAQNDIVVSMPSKGRPESRFEEVIGYFINMILLRTRFEGEETFEDILKQVQFSLADGVDHQYYPFSKAMREMNVTGTQSAYRLFQVSFFYQNFVKAYKTAFTKFKPQVDFDFLSDLHQEGEKEFVMEIFEEDTYLQLNCHFNPDLYKSISIDRISENFIHFIGQVVADPTRKIDQYEYLSPSNRQRIMHDWSENCGEEKENLPVQFLIDRQAETHPERTALVFREQEISYGEMKQRYDQLAYYLTSQGVKKGDLVAVCLNKSSDLIISILAVLQTGAAYVPVDPEYPAQRIANILEQSKAPVVVTATDAAAAVKDAVSSQTRLLLIDQKQEEIATAPLVKLDRSGPEDLAYVLFTSGSTGNPKGVMIGHHGLTNLAYGMQQIYDLTPEDRIVQFASICFDMSVEEIFPYLTCGAGLVIRESADIDPDRFCRLVAHNKVTVLNLPPAYGKVIANMTFEQKSQIFGSARILTFGGDAFDSEIWNELSHFNVQIFNLYGPTEYTVNTTWAQLDGVERIHIGKPVRNTKTYILDTQLKPVPALVNGELYIAGSGLSKGYLNQEELTQKKFVKNPFVPGELMFKTGDAVRWSAEGNIEFIGRLDNQVKIRGFRVELGEIESVIMDADMVYQSAVIAKKIKGENALIAYYSMKPGEELDEALLTNYIKKRLADYMVPAQLISLEEMPMTPNGKIDRKLLTAKEVTFEVTLDFIAPETAMEKNIARVWEEVLGKEQIGLTDNFFELGGHSLLATQVISKMKKELSLDLSLAQLFNNPQISAITRLLEKSGDSSYEAIPVANVSRYPLSFSQERLWFLHKMGKGHQYHITGVLGLDQDIDLPILEEAFNLLIARHESLRMNFFEEAEQPYLEVAPSRKISIPVHDVTHLTGDQKEEEINAILADVANQPFDLGADLLFRLEVVRVSATELLMPACMHHIISDGSSNGLLAAEINGLYHSLKYGEEVSALAYQVQYKDYAVWSRDQQNVEKLDADIQYWKEHLSGYEGLSLPADFRRPAQLSGMGDFQRYTLGQPLQQKITDFAAEKNHSAFSIYLTGLYALLHYYSRQTSINIGMPVANREHPDLLNVIGFFVNTVVNRVDIDPTESFGSFAARVQQMLLSNLEHQEAPFDKVVEAINPERDLSRTPLFQILVNYLKQPADQFAGQYLKANDRDPLYRQVKLDMSFTFTELSDGSQLISIEYSTDLFRAETIARMLTHYDMILQAIVANPQQELGAVSLLGDNREALAAGILGSVQENYEPKTFNELFAGHVQRNPHKVALRHDGLALTYGELNKKAIVLARQLKANGVTHQQHVGIYMDRSLELMIAVVAVLKIGGVYVPLGIDNPETRLTTMMADCEAAVILTDKTTASRMEAFPNAGKRLMVRQEELDISQITDGLMEAAPVGPEDNIYMIYTSGSTGKPKGVLLPHGGVTNYLGTIEGRYAKESDIAATDFALMGNISFDATNMTMLAPMISGGTVHIFDSSIPLTDMMKQVMNHREINVIKLTPTHLKILQELEVEHEVRPKILVCGGEALKRTLAMAIMEKFPTVCFVNQYGPTETSIAVTYHICSRENMYQDVVHIGQPLTNVEALVVDEFGNVLPAGIPGELCIGGPVLANGYYRDPEKTQQKFVKHPAHGNGLVYKTGDIVRINHDGNIEFLGRVDAQVKLRGYRIEPGEIESALMAMDQITIAAVILKEEAENDYLAAFYVSDTELEHDQIKDFLSSKLPEFMVPSAFVQLEDLPVAATGKLDKKALQAIEVKISSSEDYVAPSSPEEQKIADIWQPLLNVERVGVHDRFFQLGGHSLMATQVMSRINQAFNKDLDLSTIFVADTVRQLAQKVAAASDGQAQSIQMQARPEQIPLSFEQERLWFLNEMGQGTLFNVPAAFEVNQSLNQKILQEVIDALVKRHDSLRTTFNRGRRGGHQLIHANMKVLLEIHDVSGLDEARRESRSTELVTKHTKSPFDFVNGPLVRFMMIQKTAESAVLSVCLHHIITDGWSNTMLMSELLSDYEARIKGAPLQIERSVLQYADFAIWQKEYFAGEAFKAKVNFWKEKLQGFQELQMPQDHQRPEESTGEGSYVLTSLDDQLRSDIKAFATQESCTVFHVLNTAIAVFLLGCSQQNDIVIGVPVANRRRKELEGIVGFFTNTIVNRLVLDPEKTFRDALAVVKQEMITNQDYQDVPFDKVVEVVKPDRSMNKTPIFQVVTNFVQRDAEVMKGSSITLTPFDYGHNTAKYDLHFCFTDFTSLDMMLSIEYATDLYERTTIERWSADLLTTLTQLITQPASQVSEFFTSNPKDTTSHTEPEQEEATSTLSEFMNNREEFLI